MQLRPHQEKALEALARHPKGQIIVPTGGGKTLIAIKDAIRRLNGLTDPTFVVVAPRILLAEQLSSEFLEEIENVSVMHVHSGETHHFSTTDHRYLTHWSCSNPQYDKLIFTTYHSLHRVLDSDINIDRIYIISSNSLHLLIQTRYQMFCPTFKNNNTI